jgi:hypothetical protein
MNFIDIIDYSELPPERTRSEKKEKRNVILGSSTRPLDRPRFFSPSSRRRRRPPFSAAIHRFPPRSAVSHRRPCFSASPRPFLHRAFLLRRSLVAAAAAAIRCSPAAAVPRRRRSQSPSTLLCRRFSSAGQGLVGIPPASRWTCIPLDLHPEMWLCG